MSAQVCLPGHVCVHLPPPSQERWLENLGHKGLPQWSEIISWIFFIRQFDTNSYKKKNKTLGTPGWDGHKRWFLFTVQATVDRAACPPHVGLSHMGSNPVVVHSTLHALHQMYHQKHGPWPPSDLIANTWTVQLSPVFLLFPPKSISWESFHLPSKWKHVFFFFFVGLI